MLGVIARLALLRVLPRRLVPVVTALQIGRYVWSKMRTRPPEGDPLEPVDSDGRRGAVRRSRSSRRRTP